jgi:hypothetical protein
VPFLPLGGAADWAGFGVVVEVEVVDAVWWTNVTGCGLGLG